MRHIDSFCHYFPQSIFKLMSQTAAAPPMSASACRAFARFTISTPAFA